MKQMQKLIRSIDWPLLRHQKASLINHQATLLHTGQTDTVTAIEGILNLLDGFMDACVEDDIVTETEMFGEDTENILNLNNNL